MGAPGRACSREYTRRLLGDMRTRVRVHPPPSPESRRLRHCDFAISRIKAGSSPLQADMTSCAIFAAIRPVAAIFSACSRERHQLDSTWTSRRSWMLQLQRLFVLDWGDVSETSMSLRPSCATYRSARFVAQRRMFSRISLSSEFASSNCPIAHMERPHL